MTHPVPGFRLFEEAVVWGTMNKGGFTQERIWGSPRRCPGGPGSRGSHITPSRSLSSPLLGPQLCPHLFGLLCHHQPPAPPGSEMLLNVPVFLASRERPLAGGSFLKHPSPSASAGGPRPAALRSNQPRQGLGQCRRCGGRVASLGVQKGPSRRQALPPSTQEGKWVVDTGLAESEQLSACHISSSRQSEAQVLLSPHFADEEIEAQTGEPSNSSQSQGPLPAVPPDPCHPAPWHLLSQA